ncbi:hypothetical protein [Tessaracoccus oleiagri]|uniref:Uncharacterized protein n=1 Tax=Tessaracoccus oleiagri TaxID=686624 RepID=A0A1G9JQK3_9ACTN|nr:hypothetical protein [Tessaracoccus oleiagri]SDL39606.1 hypothetical protein SAMN04488242_1399 [Tessaracoccus oleiagri]
MAETRTYDPSEGDDLAKLIREALGENVRPNEPGSRSTAAPEAGDDDGDDGPTLVDLPDLSF